MIFARVLEIFRFIFGCFRSTFMQCVLILLTEVLMLARAARRAVLRCMHAGRRL